MKTLDDDRMNITGSFGKPYPFFKSKHSYNTNRIFYKVIISSIIFAAILIIICFQIKDKKIELKTLLSIKSINSIRNNLDFFDKLKTILDNDEILENQMMKEHTTFQFGGPAKFFIIPKSINKIIKVLKLCKEYSIEYFILGNGSNLLVSDRGYDGIIIKIHEKNFSDLKVEEIDETHNKVIVGGGVLMRTLAKKMCLLSLSGLEDIIDIPGTIGGGIIMNASAGGKGLIYNSLEKVKVITPEGEIKELLKKDCLFRNRGSILKDKKYMVIEAIFNLIKSDKMIIQKVMADHIFQVRDVSLFG